MTNEFERAAAAQASAPDPAWIASIAQAYGRRFDRIRDDMMKDGSIESLVLEIRDSKVVDKILEKAKVSEEEPEKK